MKRILDKLDKLDDKQDAMQETLVRNTVTLEEHVRRTDLLEAKVETNTSFIDKVKGSWKLILIVSTLLGIALVLNKLL